jgi:hypothetical protein
MFIHVEIEVGEMASDWVERKAAEAKRHKAEQQSREDWRAKEHGTIQARGHEVVDKLEATVRSDVEKWNTAFSDDQDKLIDAVNKNSQGFVIVKERFPAGVANVSFNQPALRIDIRFRRSRPTDMSDMYETTAFVHLKLHTDGQTLFMMDNSSKHISLDEMSQKLIESIAETRSQHIF